MPTPREDFEFLKNQGKRVLGFGRDFVGNTLSDTKKSRTIKAIEFGAFNWLRVLGAIAITLVFLIVFSAWRSEAGLWVVLLIFLLAYGFFFRGDDKRKGGVTGFLFDGSMGIITAIIAVVTGFFTGVFEFFKDLFLGATDTGTGLIGWVIDIVKDLWGDIVTFGTEIVMMGVGLGKDLFEIGKTIITDIGLALIGAGRDVATDLITSGRELVVDLATSIGTALREIIVDIFGAAIGVVQEIFSSFGAMLADMVTFTKKES